MSHKKPTQKVKKPGRFSRKVGIANDISSINEQLAHKSGTSASRSRNRTGANEQLSRHKTFKNRLEFYIQQNSNLSINKNKYNKLIGKYSNYNNRNVTDSMINSLKNLDVIVQTQSTRRHNANANMALALSLAPPTPRNGNGASGRGNDIAKNIHGHHGATTNQALQKQLNKAIAVSVTNRNRNGASGRGNGVSGNGVSGRGNDVSGNGVSSNGASGRGNGVEESKGNNQNTEYPMKLITQCGQNCYYRSALHLLYYVYMKSEQFRTNIQQNILLNDIMLYIHGRNNRNNRNNTIQGQNINLKYREVRQQIYPQINRNTQRDIADVFALFQDVFQENVLRLYQIQLNNISTIVQDTITINNNISQGAEFIYLGLSQLYKSQVSVNNPGNVRHPGSPINSNHCIRLPINIQIRNYNYACKVIITRGRTTSNQYSSISNNVNMGSGHFATYIYNDNNEHWYEYNFHPIMRINLNRCGNNGNNDNNGTFLKIPKNKEPIFALYEKIIN
jgi:hypothetical protein